MTETDVGLVRKLIVVEAPIEGAFAVFTARFGDSKPPERNLPIVETVFEPRVGGSIVDRAVDGSECRRARILAYDPPHQVARQPRDAQTTPRNARRTDEGASRSHERRRLPL